MPIQFKEEDNGKILEVHVSGKLVKEDYARFVPEFERLVRLNGKLCLFFDMVSTGTPAYSARNMTLLTMIILENVHVFNCMSEIVSVFKIRLSTNYFLIAGVVLVQCLHIACMHIPFMQKLLRLEPVSLKEWSIVAGLSLILLAAIEIFKFIKNRTDAHTGPVKLQRNPVNCL